ncbi:MAG: hypothetical protein GKR89_16080 [Candidatus Latescibacteria bacterium]|nr:hypothetical protein [Candidatus Latescibacterota bacterium]
MSVNEQQLKNMHNMLRTNVKIARDASMTGMLMGSTPTLVGTYNRIYAYLKKMECGLDETLYAEASGEATIDEIGVLSDYLAKFMQETFGVGLDKAARQAREAERADLQAALDRFTAAQEGE